MVALQVQTQLFGLGPLRTASLFSLQFLLDLRAERSIGVRAIAADNAVGCCPARTTGGAVGGGKRQFRRFTDEDTHYGQAAETF